MSGLRLHGVTAAPGGAPVLQRLDLDVPPGSTTTVLGASGAGKTTLLRVVAGLERAVAGTVEVGDRDVTDLPAHRRRVGVVFQEPRLFPHLSVEDNVAFGLEAAGVDVTSRRATARALLERVGLEGLADRTVEWLSGGEQQRVNLARALATDPDVLLLDEPLAAADPELRADLRRLIAEVTAGLTCVHVTHDRAEAAELGDRVAVLHSGRVAQHASPREVFEQPADAVVAGLVGATNLLRGELRDGLFHVGGGVVPLDGPDGPATVTVRPEHVRVVAHHGDDAPTSLTAVVGSAAYQGATTRLDLGLDDGQQLVVDVGVDDAPAPGARVALELRRVWLLPDGSGPS